MNKLTKLIIFIMLNAISSGCNTSSSGEITWVHIIPDNYVGWIAIQYDCASGHPLDIQDNLIKVEYDASGLFCTTASPFNWSGSIIIQNVSGIQIYNDRQHVTNTNYGECCGQRIALVSSENSKPTKVILDIRWVGHARNTRPLLDLDMIQLSLLSGRLVPSDW